MSHRCNARSPWGSFVSSSLLAVSIAGLAGCGGSITPTVPASVYPAAQTVVGHVHGGQQPVAGASIQIYTVGQPAAGGGVGQGSVPLITGTLPTTDANGNFVITGSYTVPALPSHFYIVASGGSPGFGTPANPNLVLMSTVGSCSSTIGLSPTLFVSINEITTAATLLTLQPFMAPPSAATLRAPAIGAPSNAYNNLQNAIETVNNLVDTSTGVPVNPIINWTASTANGQLLNTLADVIASCVNSDPTTNNTCSTLGFLASPASPAYAAVDTTQATYYIAQSPSHNVGSLYNLITPNGPFVPLASAPAAFSVITPESAGSCQSPVVLGSAANFEVLGASTVTNTGATAISGGNLGLSPGTSVTGFPPGVLVPPGQMIVNNPVAAAAQADLNTAFLAAAALTGGAILPADISGLTFPPGVYKANGAELNAAVVTLDGHGDPNAVFIFQIATALTEGIGSQVVLINGAQAKNVFWQVGTSATLMTNAVMVGNIMAHVSITFNTTATLRGRALAQIGAVTMDTNAITAP